MHRQDEFLFDGIAENLDRATRTNESTTAQIRNAVCTGIEELFHFVQIHNFFHHFARRRKSSELGLPAYKRRLPSFKTKIPALARAGLLTFGAAAGCRATTGGVAAGNALALGNGTPCWSKGMKHLEHLNGNKCLVNKSPKYWVLRIKYEVERRIPHTQYWILLLQIKTSKTLLNML